MAAFHKAFPDLRFTIAEPIAEGDKVVVHWTLHGTQSGEYQGRPPTGRTMTVTGTSLFRINSGKIQEIIVNMDRLGMQEQLGWLEGTPPRAATDAKSVTRADFLGTWRLVSFEAKAAGQTTYPFGREAQDTLIYSPGGRVSVVLSKPDRERFAGNDMGRGTPEEKVAAFDSCLSYFGTFEVHGNAVVHRIEHCTFPNWIGTEQTRFFQFDGNRLTLQPPPIQADGGPTVLGLVWERIAP